MKDKELDCKGNMIDKICQSNDSETLAPMQCEGSSDKLTKESSTTNSEPKTMEKLTKTVGHSSNMVQHCGYGTDQMNGNTAQQEHVSDLISNIDVRAQVFPVKLALILSQKCFSDIITWMPHGRAWKILSPKDFIEKVAPHFFDSPRYASFIRLVNAWGFKRIRSGLDANAYYHEVSLSDSLELCPYVFSFTSLVNLIVCFQMFIRGRTDLVKIMKRANSKKSSSTTQINEEPNFYVMPSIGESETAVNELESCVSGRVKKNEMDDDIKVSSPFPRNATTKKGNSPIEKKSSSMMIARQPENELTHAYGLSSFLSHPQARESLSQNLVPDYARARLSEFSSPVGPRNYSHSDNRELLLLLGRNFPSIGNRRDTPEQTSLISSLNSSLPFSGINMNTQNEISMNMLNVLRSPIQPEPSPLESLVQQRAIASMQLQNQLNEYSLPNSTNSNSMDSMERILLAHLSSYPGIQPPPQGILRSATSSTSAAVSNRIGSNEEQQMLLEILMNSINNQRPNP